MDPELQAVLLDSGAIALPQSPSISLTGLAFMEGILAIFLGLKPLMTTTAPATQRVLRSCGINERGGDMGVGGEGTVTALLWRW